MVFDCGTLRVQRAYYVCLACGETSCPLDEQLGLGEGKEQGRLREKLALLAVLTPYHQAPQVCQTLLGSERHAMTLRRVALREAEHLAASGHHHTLPGRERDRLYLEVDGHLCPTREPKDGPEDQGYREAKAVLAFSAHDVAEVSKERHEILHKILQAQITDSETVRAIFQQVYCQAGGSRAADLPPPPIRKYAASQEWLTQSSVDKPRIRNNVLYEKQMYASGSSTRRRVVGKPHGPLVSVS